MSDEGDSQQRPKRIKNDQVIVISSSSDSDSDENVGVAGTQRKKLRIRSIDDGNESSGSSVVFVGARRRVSSCSSDSSENNSSDKCSICLGRFTSQEVGTPKSCEHIFCLDCIIEWSKNMNTCPVDRKIFKTILVRAFAGGRVLRTESVQAIRDRPFEVALEDRPFCEVCDTQDYEENMMLCRRCDACYHMRCITPALGRVPYIWFCLPCRRINDGFILLSDLEEIMDAERPATIQNSRR